MLGKRQRYAGYKAYVEQGCDAEIQRFYRKGNLASVMGDKTFREQLREEAGAQDKPITPPVSVQGRPLMDKLIKAVAKAYKVTASSLTQPQQGIRQANMPRKYVMYVGQQAGYPLKELAHAFSVNPMGTISHALTHVRQ